MHSVTISKRTTYLRIAFLLALVLLGCALIVYPKYRDSHASSPQSLSQTVSQPTTEDEYNRSVPFYPIISGVGLGVISILVGKRLRVVERLLVGRKYRNAKRALARSLERLKQARLRLGKLKQDLAKDIGLNDRKAACLARVTKQKGVYQEAHAEVQSAKAVLKNIAIEPKDKRYIDSFSRGWSKLFKK